MPLNKMVFQEAFTLEYSKDIALNKRGTKAVAIGIGYGFMRLVNNLNIRKQQGAYTYNFPTNGIDLRNAFSTHQFQIPLELRWRSSRPDRFAFWRIHLGYRLSYQFAERYKPFFGSSFSLDDQLTPWQHSASVAIGYNTWNIRFAYGFSPFLRESIRTQQGIKPLIYPVQLGLIFLFAIVLFVVWLLESSFARGILPLFFVRLYTRVQAKALTVRYRPRVFSCPLLR